MNWIDKIFKDQLGSRKFPEELRNRGKADLEALLAKEMPVSGTSAAGKGAWFYGGLSAIILAVAIPLGILYFQDDKASNSENVATLNFGRVDSLEDSFVVRNKSGSSGSWNSVSKDMEPEIANFEESVTEGRLVEEASNSAGDIQQNASVANASVKSNTISNKKVTKPVLANDHVIGDQSEKTENKATSIASSKPALNKTATIPSVGSSAKSEVQEDKIATKNSTDTETLASAGEIEKAGEPAEIVKSTKEEPANTESAVPPAKGDEVIVVEIDTKNETSTPVATNSADTKSETDNNSTVEEPKVVASADDASEEEADKTVKPEEQSTEEKSTLADNSAAKTGLANLAFSDWQKGTAQDFSQYKALSPKRMAVSLWGGYTYVGKTIIGGTQEYLNLRKEKEEAVWTTPTGLTFDYYLTNKWTLSIGAGFSEYGEVLNYDYEFERTGYEDGRVGSYRNYNNVRRLDSVRVITGMFQGHWDYYFDYTDVDTAIRNNNGPTSFSYVELPVMLGYRFGNLRLKPWVQMGVSVGIPYSQNFRYMSPSLDGLQTPEATRASAADIQFNGVMTLGVDYYLTRHISIRANIMGSYQLTPAFKFEGIEQRYYRVGGTVGVAYNF